MPETEVLVAGSEFELPNRLHALLVRVLSELVEPCRRGLAEADGECSQAMAAAESAYAAIQSRSEAAVRGHQSRFRSVEAQAQAAGAAVLQICSEARLHVNPQAGNRGLPAVNGKGGGKVIALDNASLQGALAPLRASADTLRQTSLPGYWPKDPVARTLVIISSLALFFVSKPLALVWPVVVFAAQMAWRKKANADLDRLMKEAQVVLSSLTTSQDLAKRASLRDIEVAKGWVAPAVDERNRAVDRASREFKRKVESIHLAAKELSTELHEEESMLWAAAGYAAADWDSPSWASWAPDPSPEFAARLGTLTLAAPDLESRLNGIDFRFRLPALIPFADGKCLLFNAGGENVSSAAATMQSVVIRVLANSPPGKARFTFIDPVGLGQNAADFMSLGDYDLSLIGGKAWTEPQHIERQLTELTEHMETVIQKYLRTDFATIQEYNVQAHEVAEAFRFLVVFDFPVSFTEAAAKRLVSIVRNGPRCGVHVFVIRDMSRALPYGFSLSDLEGVATAIVWDDAKGLAQATWPGADHATTLLVPDTLDGHRELAAAIIAKSGQSALAAMKVVVPFDTLYESDPHSALWQHSASHRLKVPLGPTGARKPQYLTLGEGLAHHGLIVGRTGSGKTNLMHVMIVGLALSYSPSELQLYLIDLKGGVGFKSYAERALPHAAVIAIESEREFGISVLQGLDSELQRRFEIFRTARVDNLADYRKRMGSGPPALPRILLVVDEFQELFSHDDDIAQQTRRIFDRIVRQGRSFGMHILLGTQSLSGTAQLPSSTMGQMAVRIALPCSEDDARVIFAPGNLAARSLSRPGEAIYNDAAGLVEANNPFQVARLDDHSLQSHLRAIADRHVPFDGMVFEGNEPARLAECKPLAALLGETAWTEPPKSVAAWLGEPIAVLPPVAAVFRRQPGKHLLIVTRDEAEGIGALYAAWLSLLCQHRPMTARFFVMDLTTGDAPWAGYASRVRELFRHEIETVNRHTLAEVLGGLAGIVQGRLEKPSYDEVPLYFLIAGLHRARDLRPDPEDSYMPAGAEPTPARLLASILRDGPETGTHILAWCDTVTNARRTLDRSVGELGMRLSGAMSAEESRIFLDASDASRIDRPHRLIFADEEKPGVLQKLRPYSLPDLDWLQTVAEQQRRRPHE